MIDSPCALAPAMGHVLCKAADEAVMPRFQRLAEGDIEEKSPGDLVTIADREAEAIIAEGLKGLRPQARFVGEEACAADPSRLQGLGQGEVWIVDPIDGTSNFATGGVPFAMMAALLRDGEVVAACILDPLNGSLLVAEKGAGTWCDGKRVNAPTAPCPPRALSSCTGIISDFQMPPASQPEVAQLVERVAEALPTQRCAGAEYPLIASGARDFALYWRTLVWDHAPGVLILEEAGGRAARLDGTAYRADDRGGAILLAHTPDIWDQAASLLAGMLAG
ncbi:MAG: inositol monophosphatase family protein [Pseudomonadota bacterium]